MKISVFGGGLFGTALAKCLAKNDHEVLMWNFIEEECNSINSFNIHPNIGHSKALSKNIKSTTSIKEAAEFSNIYILSVPSYVISEVTEKIIKYIGNKKVDFVNTAKGFHPQTFTTVSQYLLSVLSEKNISSISTIAGPTYANELLNEQLTFANILIKNLEKGKYLAKLFKTTYFRLIPCIDLDGGEFLSAYKNVIALCAGILHGYGFEADTHAILMTIAINEGVKMLEKLSYSKNTMYKLCGIGDLILTCSSEKSRNFTSGMKIAKLNSINEAIMKLKELNITVEGIGNASVIFELFKNKNIDIAEFELFSTIIKILQSKCNIKNTLINTINKYNF